MIGRMGFDHDFGISRCAALASRMPFMSVFGLACTGRQNALGMFVFPYDLQAMGRLYSTLGPSCVIVLSAVPSVSTRCANPPFTQKLLLPQAPACCIAFGGRCPGTSPALPQHQPGQPKSAPLLTCQGVSHRPQQHTLLLFFHTLVIHSPRLSRLLDESAAFGDEPDVFGIFKMMLGEGVRRFNNPLRRLLCCKVRITPDCCVAGQNCGPR